MIPVTILLFLSLMTLPYGWGVAEYSTPEKYMGDKFTDKVYQREPEESYKLILEHLKKILPQASEEQIKKILK